MGITLAGCGTYPCVHHWCWWPDRVQSAVCHCARRCFRPQPGLSSFLCFVSLHGSLRGAGQELFLSLLDVAPVMEVLTGVVMELDDCAFPLLKGAIVFSLFGFDRSIHSLLSIRAIGGSHALPTGVQITSEPDVAFRDCDAAFLVRCGGVGSESVGLMHGPRQVSWRARSGRCRARTGWSARTCSRPT